MAGRGHKATVMANRHVANVLVRGKADEPGRPVPVQDHGRFGSLRADNGSAVLAARRLPEGSRHAQWLGRPESQQARHARIGSDSPSAGSTGAAGDQVATLLVEEDVDVFRGFEEAEIAACLDVEKPKTLRQLLENIIFTKEVWAAALAGHNMDVSGTPPAQRTPAAMLKRLEKADRELQRIFQEVVKRGAWDDTFVDALCEPAETFTFGGVFAHIMTFNAHRRLMALDALRQLGLTPEGFGCPMEYEERVAPWDKRIPAGSQKK